MSALRHKNWLKELSYIEGVAQIFRQGLPHAERATFNNDPECFARYTAMQSRCAAREGFPVIASLIARSGVQS